MVMDREGKELLRASIYCRPYDPLIFGRPWICKIFKWPIGSSPTVTWGKFFGDPNEGGFLEIAVYENDILWVGQKVVNKDGNLPQKKSWYHVAMGDTIGQAKLVIVTPSQAKIIWDRWHPAEAPLPPPTPNPLLRNRSKILYDEIAGTRKEDLLTKKQRIDLSDVSDEDLINEVKRRGLILPPNGYKRHLSF